MTKPAIIAISSHVADGSVGGRLQALALERLGFPVVLVPTVTLPFHPGKGRAPRIVPPPAGFARLVAAVAGAARRQRVGGILSGYLGDADQAAAVAGLVAAVKSDHPGALYLCDPVIGDAKGLYRTPEIVAAIGERLLPLADIATPNRHELGYLLGARPGDNGELAKLARLVAAGETVVTSAFAEKGSIGNLLVTPGEVSLLSHEAMASAPHGTGDLLAALYLAHRLDGREPAEALRRAAGATHRLVAGAQGGDALRLVAHQEALLDAGAAVECSRLSGI